MFRLFFRPFGSRSFSHSRVLRAAEKEKDIVKTSEVSSHKQGMRMDFVPNEFEKTILVLSGRYKSKADIPPRIGYDTMDNAKSRFRIRGANVLMVGTLFLCGYYIWKGKKLASEGQSITKIYSDIDNKIRADAESEKKKQL